MKTNRLHFLLLPLKKFAFPFAFLVALHASAFIDASLQMQLGNPSDATADTNNHNHYLIQRTIEALDYNDSYGQPNWASWDLTSGDANGAVPRQDSYSADTTLPANFYRVPESAYSNSGYDRGHLCPSADRTDSTNDNDMTFLMSNMMPQDPNNNRITWEGLEDYCRNLADAGNEVLIICGPSGFDGSHLTSNAHVLIASNTWKIVVVVPLGSGTALSRIMTTTNRVIAVNIPNNSSVNSDWTRYITSAHQIELQTGLSFFTALPGTIASAFRAKIDNLGSPPPPSITSFTPPNGLVNTNVVITGTNFNGASKVTFNGVDAVYFVDSNTKIIAVVPTNATTGLISVTSPGGTADSTDVFTISAASGTPDLAITSTHSPNFKQSDLGDSLIITINNNAGTGAATGTIIVSNTLPMGLTATAISGVGWTTTLANLTATRSDTLAAGFSYPDLIITVNVATNAPAILTNVVTVSGSITETNFSNNKTTDVINVASFTNFPPDATITLFGWDVSNQLGFGISPLPPTTNVPWLIVSGLTRGSGVTASGTSVNGGGWGGRNWTDSTSTGAISGNRFVYFTVGPQSGYSVSFTNISRFDYRRSPTGPYAGLIQYRINSGLYSDITNVSYTSTDSSGASIGPIDLSGIVPLQNIGAGTNVTFRIVNYGGTSSLGTWYIFDVATSTALDFAMRGRITPVPNSTAPVISGFMFTNGVFQFIVTGAAGYSYVVEASDNLSSWVDIGTNSSPFTFTDSSSTNFAERFYRARKF